MTDMAWDETVARQWTRIDEIPQWELVLDRILFRVSRHQLWRTRVDNGPWTVAGDIGVAKEPGLKGESRTAAEVVMDDALTQDDAGLPQRKVLPIPT